MSLRNKPETLEIEDVTAHRWMISYADLMTVLFCLAVALLVVSKKEDSKPKASRTPTTVERTDAVSDMVENEAFLQSRYLLKVAANAPIKVITSKKGSLIIIPEHLIFKSGDAKVQNPQALKPLFEYLASIDKKLIVSGHTDDRPISSSIFASNWELSSARASSVARLLEECGVFADKITVEARAATDPIASNETDIGRQRNRRVSIFVSVQ